MCECVTQPRRVEELAAAWNHLAERSPGAHVYQAHAWVSAWIRHMPEGKPLVYVAFRGSRLTAALPLCRHGMGVGPFSLRTLRIVSDNADFCDVLRDPDYPQDLDALWSHALARRDWDLVDLRCVPPASHLARLARAVAPPLRVYRHPHVVAPYLELGENWLGTVSKSHRATLMRLRRRLQEQGRLELTTASTPAELDALLEELAVLHAARWAEKGETSAYRVPRFRIFLREVCHRELERGHLHAYRLSLNGDTVSLGICFLYGRRLLPYVFSFSAAYAKYCPVHQLILSVAEETQRRGLADVLDFGAGDEPYKFRWTQKTVGLERTLIARPGLVGPAALWWSRTVKPVVWHNPKLYRVMHEVKTRWRLWRDR